ncbi:MAG: pilus assembly protein PilM [Anaerolineae bacterium]|nr:pilus assembly protein PilM [Anaerolineae bacterium]
MFDHEMTTLNIEEHEIRLLVVGRDKVGKWASAPLTTGLISEGLIRDPAAVGSAIRELFASQGVSKRRVVTSLTGLRSISRVVTIPQVKPGQLESAVLREAKRDMPVSLNEVHLFWKVLGERGNGQRVYVLAVPREVIDGQVEALRQAGIKPRAMDLKPLALVRAVNRKNAIITNLEDGSLDIIIVLEDVPVIVRTVALGKESPTPGKKRDRLVEELSRTIKFYNDSHREAGLHPGICVYWSGALADEPGFRETLQAGIEHPVIAPQSPLGCPDDLPVGRFLVNMGLALKRI